MTRSEFLVDRLEVGRQWTRDLLRDLHEADWFHLPAPAVGHAVWQVGHLASSQIVLVHMRCFGLAYTDLATESFRDSFGRGSLPSNDRSIYPRITDLVETFERIHTDAVRRVRDVSEAELAGPAIGDPHPMFRTREGAVGTAVMHEAFHAGQIALIRRILGRAPLR